MTELNKELDALKNEIRTLKESLAGSSRDIQTCPRTDYGAYFDGKSMEQHQTFPGQSLIPIPIPMYYNSNR